MLTDDDLAVDELLDHLDLSKIRQNLLPKSRLDPAVALLDLTRLHLKVRDMSEGEGWPLEICALAELEYRRFLTLKKLRFSLPLVPNRLIDTFWHAHILDTRNYHDDCLLLFGKYLHHYPYFGKRGDQDQLELFRAFQRTKALYLLVFDKSMDESPAQATMILSRSTAINSTMLSYPSFAPH